jgi:hypothetical protein
MNLKPNSFFTIFTGLSLLILVSAPVFAVPERILELFFYNPDTTYRINFERGVIRRWVVDGNHPLCDFDKQGKTDFINQAIASSLHRDSLFGRMEMVLLMKKPHHEEEVAALLKSISATKTNQYRTSCHFLDHEDDLDILITK